MLLYSDTVSRTGVYCSVSIALEQCKIDGVVDVFQVTKSVKEVNQELLLHWY